MDQPVRAETVWNAERFQLLVDSVRDYAIFMLDPEGRVATWNAGAERIKGYEREEIIGSHFSRFYDAADVASGKCDRELEVAARDGRSADEGWRVRKDGSRFWASVVITALRDETGALVGFAKVTRDLTDQKEAEEARLRLALTEETNRIQQASLAREKGAREDAETARNWLATTLRSIGDAVLTTDSNGVVQMMNPVAERLTGRALETAAGRPLGEIFRIVNEESGQPVESPVERVLREGVIVGLANHTLLIRSDGVRTPIADSGAPIRDDDGRIRGVVLVFRDATDDMMTLKRQRFLAEAIATLSSSLNYRETLARVANLAIPQLADWCEVHVFEQRSGALERVAMAYGDADKERVAEELRSRFRPDPREPRGVAKAVRSGVVELHADVTEELLAEWAASPEHLSLLRALKLRSVVFVPLSTGTRVLGAITLAFAESGRRYHVRDLPFLEGLGQRAAIAIDNARLYASEQRAREVADTANRSKDMFLATVSHELKTPLSAILGWSRMVIHHPLDDARKARALASIERSALVMARLIDDLLDFSRIVGGKLRIEPRVVDLAEVVGTALESIRPAAEAKGIRIVSAAERGDRPYIGDPSRLQQIVWNLASNAVKFTPPGGLVQVRLRPAHDSMEIVVSDTGTGIDPGFLPFLFDAFLQADGTISRSTGGLGLGLAITKHLVELHGGTIAGSSDGIGKGATFIVSLPHTHRLLEAPAATITEAASNANLAPPRLDGLRVLVVEDDSDTRVLLHEVLEQFGAEVTAVDSAAEAMVQFGRVHPPDVLLSDIAMPGQNGYDLIRWVRDLPPAEGGEVPAAALTAYARPEDYRRAIDAGFTTHVPKPVDPAELARVVETLAAKR